MPATKKQMAIECSLRVRKIDLGDAVPVEPEGERLLSTGEVRVTSDGSTRVTAA